MRTGSDVRDHAKAHGVHYTPPGLAAFLAEVTTAALPAGRRAATLRVLDPACGDGGLLVALTNAVPKTTRRRLILEGCETDGAALAKAVTSLRKLGVAEVVLRQRDFLADAADGESGGTRGTHDETAARFDLVIANPPYVRTQVLGAKKARSLAKRFGLTGRVDLSHAFAIGMAAALKPGGVLGLLTSNRFLTTRAGASLRRMFATNFDIDAVYDLGDTKLFSAAVLPVILVARKRPTKTDSRGTFHRIYEHRDGGENGRVRARPPRADSALSALRDTTLREVVATSRGAYRIERGRLCVDGDAWSLSTPESTTWLETVAAHQAATFGDLANVRVGIKSTADEVFVREDWDDLPENLRPEKSLLRPLLTHREAARWLPRPAARRVLYPHTVLDGRRIAVDLADHPRAAAYFRRHQTRLKRRAYVVESGRQWYELWVPHHPDDWAKPKLAWPDIAETPRFFLDAGGSIIQGDCYWLTLHDGVDADWLKLMLAVANSTFITKYYDTVFHNKLYAGRRRFMTQYVARFPLPPLETSRPIVKAVSKLLNEGPTTDPTRSAKPIDSAERTINRLVWQAFGLDEEIPWREAR